MTSKVGEISISGLALSTFGGALVGMIIGGLIWGPDGALLGTILGALLGGFLYAYNKSRKIESTTRKYPIGLTTLIGTVGGVIIGFLTFGPAGAVLGGLLGFGAGSWVDIDEYYTKGR